MRKIAFVFLLAFLSFAPVVVIQAQGPTPTPDENNSFGQLRETDVVTMPAGFDFTPVELVTPTVSLSLTIGVDEINTIGQIVTSTFVLLDQFSILPYLLVLLLALFVLRWLYKFVTGMPGRSAALDVSGAIDDYYDLQESRLQQDYIDEDLADQLRESRSRRRRARGIVGRLR